VAGFDPSIPVPGLRRLPRATGKRWRARHPRQLTDLGRIRALLLALFGIGVAAASASGWILAGGGLPTSEALLGRPDAVPLESSSGGAPVHIESTPSGAAVRIDGRSRGTTPLDVYRAPRRHLLSLHHPDTLDEEQPLQVGDDAASARMFLWRRPPEVVPVRLVYPGASLIDAHFLDDRQVALLGRHPADRESRATTSCGGWIQPRPSSLESDCRRG
jgi:hypothetical protein